MTLYQVQRTRGWQTDRAGQSPGSPQDSEPVRPGWCPHLGICQGDLGLQLLHLLLQLLLLFVHALTVTPLPLEVLLKDLHLAGWGEREWVMLLEAALFYSDSTLLTGLWGKSWEHWRLE